jgi:16S rRNA processing protein RimM
LTLVTAGRVGRSHGHDGSFYVEGARHPLPLGTSLTVAGRPVRVERRAGTDGRPLIRLEGVDDPRALRGTTILVEAELAPDEWLAADLVGCEVAGHGAVRAVLDGPSCSVLELDDGRLVPFVSDAILAVDTDARSIRVDDRFLGEP